MHRVRREEAGLSLIELLVSAGIMMTVLNAMMMLGEVAQRSTPKEVKRANAVQTARPVWPAWPASCARRTR